MLFPKVNRISVHISTYQHITEQFLCRTFSNCSLCDRLNLRKKVCLHSLALSVYEISQITRIFPHIRIRQQSVYKHSSNFETVEIVRSSNIVEFELRHISI